ncbi:Tgt2/MlaC family protein [Aliarcobacter cibarius]|uniref:ABC transporter substrate-binding protein n=1 Tax=Aliarcobacter cibarius TaxID=255507 RepID=A0A5J6RGD2_9BACT|nr:ABC transporter substrate-binding protein [Aliarcobacter cibarius]QEZ88945.1 lipid asymmetry ABC transporter MlaABCDEF, periplasmic component MlaC [Aliarcobacter cibarius]QKJ26989.1 lipid asymmetry ABC transporter MlaABCDEF, periplasmic component MlaC [Aliarcobacter cibarius]TLS98511.1 ABC transporter substrate-binding protein [Aliarcobacter cibarius]TLS99179.1 ABC transporter substrate-binding protein [Aliarcobacter cibarius]TLT03644.1 ABC transporter substrate-binding protein [Aliarcobact
MFKSNLLKITIILTILLTNSYALKKEEIQSEMAERIDNVLVVLKNKSLSKEEKKNQVISIVNDTFDFELMAKIALGKHSWETLSEEKQKEFTATFEDKLKKSYSDKLELYNDQKVKILSLDPYNNTRLQLKTELLGKEGTYSINYNFYEKNGEWYIYDVDLIGVSIIQTYRQQFSGLLKEKSFDDMFAQFKNQ